MSEENQDSRLTKNASDQDEDTTAVDISDLGDLSLPSRAMRPAEWKRGLLETTETMRALNSTGEIGTMHKQVQGMMKAIGGLGNFDRIGSLQRDIQATMSAITGMGSLDRIGTWQRDMQASMRAITGVGAFEGLVPWQKSIQDSMRAISGIGVPSGIDAMQKMLISSPLQSILDLHAKTWLGYPQVLTAFDSLHLQMPHLVALTETLQAYDFRIEHQIVAFQQVPALRPYQKRALIAHESRQKRVRLGPADLENADLIAQGISSTQTLIDGIANVEDEREHPLSPAFEEEVFDVLEREGTEYLIPLRGAIQTAASDNPDKVRQTIASLRELTTHILHKLSPDEEVKKWSKKEEHYFNKRPTRACRLEFIFRDCMGSSIQPYIENEVKFTKDFFELLNNGTHSLDTHLTESDLMFTIYKTESLILLLLKYARR